MKCIRQLKNGNHVHYKQTPRKPATALEQHELEMMFAMFDKEFDEVWADFFKMTYFTGARISEMCHLTLENIDLKNNEIHIPGQYRKGGRVTLLLKIPYQIGLIVQRSVERAKENKSKWKGKLFKTSRMTAWRRLKECSEMCGIQKIISPHVLRATRATLLLKAGIGLDLVKIQLGHSSVVSTLGYSRRDHTDLDKAIRDAGV